MIEKYSKDLSDKLQYFETKIEEKKHLPTYQIIKNGIVLPRKFEKGSPYQGKGGVIDSNCDFVVESAIFDLDEENGIKENKLAFGGSYEYCSKRKINKTAIYLGVANKHWGHFLIDNVQRTWFAIAAGLINDGNNIIDLDDSLTERYEYVYSGTGQFGNELTGSYKEFFELLGIDARSVRIINEPTEYENVIVPSVAIYPGRYIHSIVKEVFQIVVNNAIKKEYVEPEIIDKIFFSRGHLPNQRELGAQNIENAFRKCGFTVLYPEELSLAQQIFYWNSAKEIACINGTLPHNCVFAQKDLSLYVVNKMSKVVGYQATMDKIWGAEPIYISAYKEPFKRYPLSVDSGPFWLVMNSNMESFFKDYFSKVFVPAEESQFMKKYILMCIKSEVKNRLRGLKKLMR